VALCSTLSDVTGHRQIGFDAVAVFLAATPTRLLSIAVEDVLGVKDQPNVPGTINEHPNWRRRWPVRLDELRDDQRLARIAATLSRAGRGSSA
jgi:4-alpha-glucanotransferase